MLGFGTNSLLRGAQKLVGRLIIAAAGGQSFANLVLQASQGQTGNMLEINSPTGTGGDKAKISSTGAITAASIDTTAAFGAGAFYSLAISSNSSFGGDLIRYGVKLGINSSQAGAVGAIFLVGMGTSGGNNFTATSGNCGVLQITPTYNQGSGTAANTDLQINRTETALGSGAQNFVDLQVGSVSFANITNKGVANFRGTITNDNATALYVGELVTATVASGSAVSLTTATAANVTSISLTAGDWEVWGVADYSLTGATTTDFKTGTSSTSATFGGQDTFVNFPQLYSALSDTLSDAAPRTRFSLSATTTIYLVAQSTFSIGTVSVYGSVFARRVR